MKGADRNGDGAVSFDEFRMHIAGLLAPPQHEPNAGKLDPGNHLRVVQVEDLERRYRVHLPKSCDGMRVTRKTWSGGKGGSEVVLIEIEGGGHTWPGREPVSEILGEATMDISANDLMWEFFQKHRRRTKDERPQPDDSPDGAAVSEATMERKRSKEATAIEANQSRAMELLRTPDSRFADLPGYDFEPRYVFVDDPNLQPGNRRIRVHYAVSGPADAPSLLMLHGNRFDDNTFLSLSLLLTGESPKSNLGWLRTQPSSTGESTVRRGESRRTIDVLLRRMDRDGDEMIAKEEAGPELRRWFDRLDADRDGKFGDAELRPLVDRLGR